MRAPLRSPIRVLPGLCRLLWTVLPVRAQPDAPAHRGPTRDAPLPCASGPDAIPSGLAVLLPSGEKNYRSMNLRLVSNPFVRGVAVQINWRDIEPAQDAPDWSKLDALFAAAEAAGKWVHLIMFPGFFSPPWALEGAQTDLFEIEYGPGHDTVARLPMPWDRVYLERWFAFMRRLSQRYGGSPAFRMIAAAGPTSVSVEMTLPAGPPAVRRWLDDSYTPQKYLEAWRRTLRFYSGAFPNQCVSLAAPGLPILAKGKRNHEAHMQAKQKAVERAMRIVGNRLAIQSSNLHAGYVAVDPPDETGFIINYSGSIITGFEMRSGAQGPEASKVMGAEGDPPLALKRSIDKGMRPNASGRHVDYLEIYATDVIPADMQPTLKYGASLFHY